MDEHCGFADLSHGSYSFCEAFKVAEEAKPERFSKQRRQDCAELWVAETGCSSTLLSYNIPEVTESCLRSEESTWVFSP